MEDNFKRLKVEYLSNNLLDHIQIWKLCLYDQIKFYKSIKWRRTQMEDDLKILKSEYIRNHLFDHTQVLS